MLPASKETKSNWVLPFSSFKLGAGKWRVKMLYTKEYALMQHKLGEWPDTRREYGLTSPTDRLILIHLDQHHSQFELLNTLFHEIGHAVLFEQGVYDPKSHPEFVIDAIGRMVAQMWMTARN